MWVDDRYVAAYVAAHPDTLIGFLSVDPTQPGWETRAARRARGTRPSRHQAAADVRRLPPRRRAARSALAVRREAPPAGAAAHRHDVRRQAPLECTLPRHLDAVAIRHPDVKIILAHLGHPYEGECVATIRKHPNVYADISALHYRPFQFYHSLMLVQEYGVWDKVLFGTDYPFTTVNATLDGLRTLNQMLEGTALPRLDEKKIEAMIARDTLALLGLES